MRFQTERKKSASALPVDTDHLPIERACKRCRLPPPPGCSLQVAANHPGVQGQYAAATGLSRKPASQRNQPTLHIVSIGVKMQRPTGEGMAQYRQGETEPRTNQVHIQNAASYSDRRQLPVDFRYMHRYSSVRRRQRADQQNLHMWPLASTNRW